MTINETIRNAWKETYDNHQPNFHHQTGEIWVFDCKTRTVVFECKGMPVAIRFIEDKCAQAVADALREAGYLS